MATELSARNGGSPSRFGSYLSVAVIGIAGLLVTLGWFTAARRVEQRRSLDQFHRLAADRTAAVQNQIDGQLHALHALRGLFDASDAVTRSDFETFVDTILTWAGGVQAFEWVPHVPHTGRSDFEKAGRAGGLSEFVITERNAEGDMVAAAERPDYYPVLYVSPAVGNERALGFDVASDPTRRVALEASRNSGAEVASAPITLVQETSVQRGVLIFLPVSDKSTQELRGFVLGVFRTGDLLDTALARLEPAGVDVTLFDDSTPSSPEELAHLCTEKPTEKTKTDREPEHRTHPISEKLLDRYRNDLAFDVGGRRWRISCVPTAELLDDRSSWTSWGVLASGLLLTFTMTGYQTTLAGRRSAESARVEAEESLRQAGERFKILVENAPEAIVVLDADTQRFIDVNQNAVRLFKMSRQKLLGANPGALSPEKQPGGQESMSYAGQWIDRALRGEIPVFEWSHLDGEGNEVPCEIRLVRLPYGDRRLLRGSITDISERKQVEHRQRMLMRELDHRVKNNLSAVLAITEQSISASSSLEEFQIAFTGRIRALARLHEALARAKWEGAEIEEISRLTLGAFMIPGNPRVRLNGDRVLLPARASSPICMALHELTTNATKYGALSTAEGRVELAWEIRDNGSLLLTWQESAGPTVRTPEREGFGSLLIKNVVVYELSGEVQLDFLEEGLRCTIEIPREALGETLGIGRRIEP